MKTCIMNLMAGTLVWAASAQAASIQPLAYRTPDRWPDALEVVSPAEVQVQGWLGQRVTLNEQNRLVKVDLEPLLAGFRKKPGVHPWIGEHVGKWMHASTLAWAATGDVALRQKLDYAAAELVKAQELDGYLGTYVKEKRFGLFPGADWDVWSHKYNLMGLLTYYQYTGNEPALAACRKIGDLLINTFGPGKKNILSAGTHLGMAATSVLEPVVLLYRFTGDERYLEFARSIVRSWDAPDGPQIIGALLKEKQVNKTANAKAYEMLSNLVGLCELARATGDRAMLEPVLNAWQDIVSKRLYLTGSASQSEHFHNDYELPNATSAHVAECCVTTTWIQLNWQLLRLTGEARYGDQLEKSFYNHLAAAQRPDGAEWCYFTSLEGTKPYGPGINCCVSSGPRGMALVPQSAFLKKPARDGAPEMLVISLFDSLRATTVFNGQEVVVHWDSSFPRAGQGTLRVEANRPVQGTVRIRVPEWARPCQAEFSGGRGTKATRPMDGWLTLTADDWSGAVATVRFNLAAGLVLGDHGNTGRAALTWGPFVLAYDQSKNKGFPAPLFLGLADTAGQSPFTLTSAAGQALAFESKVRSARLPETVSAALVPFADAGGDGGRYLVWMRAPGTDVPSNTSLTSLASESRSRAGNLNGSITDGDATTMVVTFDGKPATEDWFAVAFEEAVSLNRVVFNHGHAFHDGGWFDASAGKPVIQVRRDKSGPWTTVATLESYPASTTADPKGLQDGQAFTQRLKTVEKVVALRVLGKPACGDNTKQSFASCAELQVFEDK